MRWPFGGNPRRKASLRLRIFAVPSVVVLVGFLLMVCSFRVERLRDCSRCEPERRRIRTAGKPSTELLRGHNSQDRLRFSATISVEFGGFRAGRAGV